MLNTSAAQELAEKLELYGCNVVDVDTDKITAYSVDYWANCTDAHDVDFLSDGEEVVFSKAELFAITVLAAEIAAILNSK